MAEIFDPFKAAPEAPSIADPFAPGYKPPTLAGEFGKGVAGGIDALQGAGYGLVGLAGDALGANGVRDWGLAGYQRNQQEQQANAPAVGRFEDIGSLKDAGLYAAQGLGQLAPFAASSLVTGGLGGIAGRVAGGAAAKAAGERLLAEKAGEVAAGRLTQEAAAKAAQEAAGSALSKSMVRGAMAGAAANSIGTEQGLIYGDIYDQTGQTAPGTAALYGLGAGLLDVLPEAGLIGKIAGKQATKGLVREVLGQAGKEAATEGAQTVVERGAVSAVDPSKETFSQEGISDIANSAILGGLGGGVAGAGGKLFAGKPAAVVTDSTSAPAQPAVDPNTGPIGRAAATAQVTGAAQEQQRISALRAAADQAMAGANAPAGTATDTTSEKASAQQSPSGSFGNLAEFESLLNQERGDLAGRRQALADAQQQDREARLAEIGNAVDYARTAESERQRNAVMDQVFSAPETAYASPQQLTQAFSGALAQAGFRDTAPTEREQARMARALDARSAILQSERQAPAAGSFGNLADFESLLNSEQADLGNRRMALQRQQANAPTGLTPEKQTRLADELAAGWKPFGKRGLVSASGKKHLLSIPELDYLRSLQEQSNGAVPGQTPTEVAAQGDQARGAEPGGSAGNVEPQPAVERGPGAGAGTAVPGVQPDVAVRDVAGWGGVDAKSRIAELQAQRDKHGPLDKESFALAEQLHPLVVKDAQDAIGSGTMPVYETGNGTFIAVHPSAQNAGKIQVTRISGSGVFGDSQYNNLKDVDSSEGLWFRRRLSDKDAEDVFKRAADAEAAYQARRNGGVDATQAQGARPAGVEAAPSVGNEAPGRAQVAQGTAPVQIPAVQNAPTFDFSGKSPDQIAWLSGHGINGWKEAAQAEIARRNQSEQNLGMVPTAPQPTNPAPVQAAPTTLLGLSGVQLQAMQGGKLTGGEQFPGIQRTQQEIEDRKSTRLNSSHHS